MSIRVGLIGAGRMGKVFAHTLAFTVSEVELIAVADIDSQTSREVAARYGAKHHFTDYHELLKREDIDAVVIVTPTSTHAEIIKAAAAAGKHIFSEKRWRRRWHYAMRRLRQSPQPVSSYNLAHEAV
jgi:predicted dehydrogenase